MKKIVWLLVLSSVGFGWLCAGASAAEGLGIADLRCEYLVNPLGIDETQPRLSWQLESGQRGQKQTAYRILVASSQDQLDKNVGDLWDTGNVKSDQSSQIVYTGQTLEARTQCFWKVMVWDAEGKPSAWSPPAKWSMGLLKESDWQAKWICPKLPEPELAGGISIVEASYGTKEGKTA